MRKLYFFLFLFLAAFPAHSQIISFPDANLKARLLDASSGTGHQFAKDINGNFVKIDTNLNGEIEVSEAQNISWLSVSYCEATDLTGLEYFSNLITFHCAHNQITTLETAIDGMANLQHLICDGTLISYINTQAHPGLKTINAGANPNLTSLDLTGLYLIEYLELQYSNIVSIDASDCHNLIGLDMEHSNTQSVSIKNGITEEYFLFSGCGQLDYVCADEDEMQPIFTDMGNYGLNFSVNSYCSLTPGGQFYTIVGDAKFDADGNGCGADPIYPNLKMTVSNGTTTNTYYANSVGHHELTVRAGTHTITPILENPSYFIVSPTSATVTFPSAESPHVQDFCIVPSGPHPDMEISIFPLMVARPGFDCTYKIVYKNSGNTVQDGSVTFNFDASILTVQSVTPLPASQSGGAMSWNFTGLNPFESRELLVVLKINSPLQVPPVQVNDVLTYNCAVLSAANDETPANNSSILSQLTVNSWDPNDKICTEGTVISTVQVGNYVHYLIRFENTGNYAAENVIIRDVINTTKFVVSSLVPLSGSHPFFTRIVNGNRVEFIFENINLPFDDANNDGYVAFKIKTKPSLAIGDTFSNAASIYFDYNFPIVTNTATTTIQLLGNPDFEFSDAFALYPNPVENTLHIQAKNGADVKSLSVYNALGQLLLIQTGNVQSADVSGLPQGQYFLEVEANGGRTVGKFIKQ